MGEGYEKLCEGLLYDYLLDDIYFFKIPSDDLIDQNLKKKEFFEDLRKLLFSKNFLKVQQLDLNSMQDLNSEILE